MSIKVSNKLNYYLEALGVLTSYMKDIPNHEDLKYKLKQKHNIPLHQIETVVNDVAIIYNNIISNVDISKEKLNFFKAVLDESIPNLNDLVNKFIIYNDDENDLNALLSHPTETKRRVFVNFLFTDTEFSNIMTDNSNEKDFVNCINKLNIDNDAKVSCILLYYNIDEYLLSAVNILKNVVAVVKQYKDEMQLIADKFQLNMQKLVDRYGEDIFDYFDIKVDKNNNIVIKPMVMFPNTIMVKSMSDSKSKFKNDRVIQADLKYGFFGVHAKEIHDLIMEYFVQDDKIITLLKALGDKSKFDILRKVKDNKMYGSELAKTLNLTTATVSHHMNHLYNLTLVNVITDSNKINYVLNKETIRDIIRTLENLFLN